MSNIPDAEDTRSHVVYRCYDESGQLVYIGCTIGLHNRMQLAHPVVSGHTARIETEAHPNRLSARDAERAAIRSEAPLLNKQHNPTRFKGNGRTGYTPVEPVHPLTAEMVRQECMTEDEKRAAMLTGLEKVADMLGLNEWSVRA